MKNKVLWFNGTLNSYILYLNTPKKLHSFNRELSKSEPPTVEKDATDDSWHLIVRYAQNRNGEQISPWKSTFVHNPLVVYLEFFIGHTLNHSPDRWKFAVKFLGSSEECLEKESTCPQNMQHKIWPELSCSFKETTQLQSSFNYHCTTDIRREELCWCVLPGNRCVWMIRRQPLILTSNWWVDFSFLFPAHRMLPLVSSVANLAVRIVRIMT